jgi:hypothetical protein
MTSPSSRSTVAEYYVQAEIALAVGIDGPRKTSALDPSTRGADDRADDVARDRGQREALVLSFFRRIFQRLLLIDHLIATL